MDYENRPLQMSGQLNQRNLNHLQEEANNYIDDNEKQSIYEDQDNNLKNYIDELNKKILDKDEIIHNQSFQIQTLNQMIENLKKNTKHLHEKLAEYEKLKIHISAQNKKMADMEKETEAIKQEYMYYNPHLESYKII